MGIATALVRSWENGISQPDCKQLEHLTKIFKLKEPKYLSFKDADSAIEAKRPRESNPSLHSPF
jgi:transcriptional regulator with XRE-family HTH domain